MCRAGLKYSAISGRKSYVLSNCPCDVFFCCSAGVGRTGVFITLSIVLERMRYEGVVDIFQTVKMLRTQRPAMVQTEVRGHTDTGMTSCFWEHVVRVFSHVSFCVSALSSTGWVPILLSRSPGILRKLWSLCNVKSHLFPRKPVTPHHPPNSLLSHRNLKFETTTTADDDNTAANSDAPNRIPL